MNYRQLTNFSAYEIYADGRIIRKKWKTPHGNHLKRKELTQTIIKNGYSIVRLMNDQGEHKTFLVHRLIWTAFEGEIAPGIEIDHINGLRSGKDANGVDANDLSNLRAVSHSTNCRNARSMENYKRANALSAGKFDRIKMIESRGEKRYEQLKQLYMELYNKHARVGIWLIMNEGHTGYPRACKLVAEMEEKLGLN